MSYSKESFEEWLKEKPEKLKQVIGDFAKGNNLKLDFSIASLDELEKWALKHYDIAADLRDEEDILDMLALYVGETFMKYIGGEWYVEFENKKNIFYLQLVMKYQEEGETCLRSAKALCTSCISRKRGNLISSTLKKHIERGR